ncbi:Tex family protein [Thermophagus sp. OGC60D27]|uniref:Tex family protein n=1 Tax=Thermophagus sp. OGC60D27 TaxID=3458415 RepID=UPI0040384800
MRTIPNLIAEKTNISASQIQNTIELLDEGATIPFISRYRKERTGSLDEVAINSIKEYYEKFKELEKRKMTVLKAIEEQDALTEDLKDRIDNCYDPVELEDLYLPYKPKRKTRASKAKERGLEPLAKTLFKQFEKDIETLATKFLNDEVPDVDAALQGARDIIAEWINENKTAREIVRNAFYHKSVIASKLVKDKEEEGAKYRDYFEWSEPLKKCPSHRFLAMQRGEKEGFLKISAHPDQEEVMPRLERLFLKGETPATEQVAMALQDAYKRLLAPSLENETLATFKEKADEEAIKVFAENLRQLLLTPPLGQKRVLAIDPGYRTGCKVVCLDAQGQLLHNETIYPHPPQKETGKAMKKLASMVDAYNIEAIAIGNGTASRETEAFVRKIKFDRDVLVFVVSEDGASVYSASKVAREEFPDYDVTVRGAVSIGRRLMDPLAELVKIDPKSIGVGQYQHDVDQTRLKEALDRVVESVVNMVGVNLNTASHHLLTYISGLGPSLAKNIVAWRNENGAFQSREDLKKVPRLGARAYEQAAGFLRISNAKNPLDNTAVHPESYPIVTKMANDLKCNVSDLIQEKKLRDAVDLNKYITPTTGLPTLKDIMQELEKPGRDPRQTIKVFEFAKDVFSLDDLKPGMVVPGIVTNITNFGAFVDVGVKQDGLVHISQLADRFVSNPADVVKLHQHVEVKVLDVDVARKRIQLSMKI